MKARGGIPTCSNPSIQRSPSPHGHQSGSQKFMCTYYICIYIYIYAKMSTYDYIYSPIYIYMDFMMKSSFFGAELSKTTCPGFPSCETRGPAHVCWEGISFTRQHLGRHVGPRPPCSWALPVLHWSPKNMHWPLRQILIYIYIYSTYIYIYRLKAGGSPELRGTLSLDAIPERSFLYTDGGGGGVGGV